MTSGGENEKMNPTPMEKRRTIAITVGDSAGIGPEISLRCADQLKNQSNLDIILYGCEKVLNRVAEHLNLAPYSQIENVGVIDPDQMISGQATATTGLASFQAEDGIRDCLLSRGLGDVYKRQVLTTPACKPLDHEECKLQIVTPK